MATKAYSSATEYFANQITVLRGNLADILEVLVYHNVDPNIVPAYADCTVVQLVDGTAEPPDALSETGKVDVLSKIGPGVATSTPAVPAGELTLTPGDYQRWVGVLTATEFIIRPTDVLEMK